MRGHVPTHVPTFQEWLFSNLGNIMIVADDDYDESSDDESLYGTIPLTD